jgi:hypothetical protein
MRFDTVVPALTVAPVGQRWVLETALVAGLAMV